MADRQYQIPEIVRPGHRNGRHVNHDPRSLRYLTAPANVAVTPKSVKWERVIPILDQGQLGSCTANAGTGILGSEPFFDTLDKALQTKLLNARTAEEWAVALYTEVTATDPFPGQYPPTDTGSDGLSLAKVLKSRGLIAGYTHATSLAAAHVAIQAGPFAVGTVWLADMENPSREGIVTATGAEEGGHEYECVEYDLTRDLWWFDNSWTEGWGVSGSFAMDSANFSKLLAQQGDVTSFVPITQPAPTPTPVPAPPGPVNPLPPAPSASTPPDSVREWAQRTQTGRCRAKRDRDAAQAYLAWLDQQ